MNVEFGHDSLRNRGADAVEKFEGAFYEGGFREAKTVDEHLEQSANANYPIPPNAKHTMASQPFRQRFRVLELSRRGIPATISNSHFALFLVRNRGAWHLWRCDSAGSTKTPRFNIASPIAAFAGGNLSYLTLVLFSIASRYRQASWLPFRELLSRSS